MALTGDGELEQLLSEQAAYYHALGEDYLHQGLDLPGGRELAEALEAFRPAGRVLELACGPGVWTGQLLRHATEITAVDASPDMLAVAAARVGSDRVRFVRADLFDWAPERRYDVVSSASGCRMCRRSASTPSGRSCATAWRPMAASS